MTKRIFIIPRGLILDFKTGEAKAPNDKYDVEKEKAKALESLVGFDVTYRSHGSPNGKYKPRPIAAKITDARNVGNTLELEAKLIVFNPSGIFFTDWLKTDAGLQPMSETFNLSNTMAITLSFQNLEISEMQNGKSDNYSAQSVVDLEQALKEAGNIIMDADRPIGIKSIMAPTVRSDIKTPWPIKDDPRIIYAARPFELGSSPFGGDTYTITLSGNKTLDDAVRIELNMLNERLAKVRTGVIGISDSEALEIKKESEDRYEEEFKKSDYGMDSKPEENEASKETSENTGGFNVGE